MPFCNSCGNNVESGAGSCPKCGAKMTGAATAAPAAAPPAKGGGGVVKVLLLILGFFVLMLVMVFAVMGYAGYRGYKAAKAAQAKIGEIKVDMPGDAGSTTATTGDATKIAQEMEVEVYPGAEAQKGAASVSMGGFSVAGANFVSSDTPAQVADFYKKQYPKAMLVSEGGDHYSIMVNTPKGTVTVSIQPYDGKTRISIARVAGAKMPGVTQPN